jgi:hypothetical protein
VPARQGSPVIASWPQVVGACRLATLGSAMRYLTVNFALGALRRGSGIQQVLGTDCVLGRPTLRWLTAWRDRDGGYVLTIHHVFDEGSEQFWDVAEFSPSTRVKLSARAATLAPSAHRRRSYTLRKRTAR